MFTQILTALDGSEYAERALSYTSDLAKIAEARVFLLAVIPSVHSAGIPVVTEPDEARIERAQTYLQEKAEALREGGVADITTLVRSGDPARLITEVAREVDTELIVMSTQSLGADGRYGLGSVALKVLMTAPCPLFLVRINKPEPPRSAAEER